MEQLIEFLKIKSVSAQDKYKPEMKRAREFLVKNFKDLGFTTRILKGKKHDAVFAQRVANPKVPTVLIYGHYDVQPPEPLDQWKSDPFNPVIKKGKIFARGATDNKGQFMAQFMAVRELLTSDRGINLNLKFLVEGEEEIGSVSIEAIAKKYATSLLAADLIVVSDSEMYEKGLPTIDVNLRGLTYAEIFLRSGKGDVHSGQFGGVAPNPAIELARIIAKLKNEEGKILVPGFYDDVEKPTDKELADFKNLPVSKEKLMQEGGMFYVDGGEKSYSLNERRWVRPTLDVNGITSGYQGEGSKTIIPAEASAKISMRLVPNQNPDKVFALFSKYVKSMIPKGMKARIVNHSSALPYKAPVDAPVFELMKQSLKRVHGVNAVFGGVGGSIGFVPIVAKALGVPCLMVGFGLPDENLHAPNEHFRIDNYIKGIRTMTDFYHHLTASSIYRPFWKGKRSVVRVRHRY